tara:strand:- start:6400 stop:7179 length:780 start_codon:yes stop_codon:yes gene_type:complete
MPKRFSLLLILLATAALAQDEPLADPIEARRYTVEMIIFAYGSGVSSGNEIFVPDMPPEEESQMIDEFGVVRDDTLQSIPETTPEPVTETLPVSETDEPDVQRPLEIESLDAADFELMNVIEHLDRLDAYEPLVHFGWTQVTYADQPTEARPLSYFVTPPDGLAGDINLYLSRYLHLALNLQLDAPQREPELSAGASSFAPSYPVRYRINEDRIFRNGELRYFDHPKFGVLAKITRVEEEDTQETQDLEETELLGYGSE